MPAEIGYSLRRGRGGSLDCVWGVQTHSGPPVFLVLFRKDLAWMNGTPQPNQKWLPALGIEPGSLDHESQPLTIGPHTDAEVSKAFKNLYKTFPAEEKFKTEERFTSPHNLNVKNRMFETNRSTGSFTVAPDNTIHLAIRGRFLTENKDKQDNSFEKSLWD